jgi:hypothetical protein
MSALRKAEGLLAEAKTIFARCDGQGREPTEAERRRIEANLDQIERLKGSIEVERFGKAIGRGGNYLTPTDPNAIGAFGGWSSLAGAINLRPAAPARRFRSTPCLRKSVTGSCGDNRKRARQDSNL